MLDELQATEYEVFTMIEHRDGKVKFFETDKQGRERAALLSPKAGEL